MAKFKKVGGGSYGVYKKEKDSVWPAILGGLIILFIIGAVFG